MGWTRGLEKEGKGIYLKQNKVVQQGYYTCNKLDKANEYVVVDLMNNENNKKSEEQLALKIQKK